MAEKAETSVSAKLVATAMAVRWSELNNVMVEIRRLETDACGSAPIILRT